ncbi:oleosin 1-like [Durio zibethinus]|uniref:Oleosin 1-like n=1 Tax=Durio zibethinus TaxID=66656 RepID=A0A6P5YA50_DURZI|nr:oleosin 1-like [Durio zibethinus]
MADQCYGQQQEQEHQRNSRPRSQKVMKTAAAVTAGGSLLVLSGLTLATTVIGLTIVTPLFIIFSPVLVPSVIAAALLVTGFVASGGFSVAAIFVLSWIYRYLTGRNPPGVAQLEYALMKLASKAREIKDKAEELTGAAAS